MRPTISFHAIISHSPTPTYHQPLHSTLLHPIHSEAYEQLTWKYSFIKRQLPSWRAVALYVVGLFQINFYTMIVWHTTWIEINMIKIFFDFRGVDKFLLFFTIFFRSSPIFQFLTIIMWNNMIEFNLFLRKQLQKEMFLTDYEITDSWRMDIRYSQAQ